MLLKLLAMTPMPTLLCALFLSTSALTRAAEPAPAAAGPLLPSPILFVTQPPNPYGFATVNETFGNHQASVQQVPRGGDLWIRYPDGTLKNLTQAAGFGSDGFQGAGSIAVRDPSVHWSGNKAVFAMVVGSNLRQYELNTFRWQLYEVAGLGLNDTPVITPVANQPVAFNNISPAYGTDDRILFTSDRPRSGLTHHYPQLDEYELSPTVSGLWSLDPATGDLRLLDHAPSGDFTPIVDSFGRVIFTRWDHLQRDQLADADAGPVSNCYGGIRYGTFDWSDEGAAATYDLNARLDVFPEPRGCRNDLLAGTNLEGHLFNHFFPWQVNEDGSELETLNHVGRQELHRSVPRSIKDDPNVTSFYDQLPRFNPRSVENLFQVRESGQTPGRYVGTSAPEFATHASGQIVTWDAPPSLDAAHIAITWQTHPETASYSDTPGPGHSGHYRDPLILADGTLLAAHTAETREDRNQGSTASPVSRYDFRLKTLVLSGNGYRVAGDLLTGGIVKNLSFWNPDVLVSYSGPMWELQPVEVRARPRPARRVAALPGPESQVLSEEGVSPAELRAWMAERGLALIVSRDVTTRDAADRQQPFNLRVTNGSAQSIGAPGRIYEMSHLQLFQGDQIRGRTGQGGNLPLPGRRVLARPLHDPAAVAANPPPGGGPPGAVEIASDGSVAAFVPARRALTWQTTDPLGTGVVRERFWVSFQPGEVRVCASCHGLNQLDQTGAGVPVNKPEALRRLLVHWKESNGTGGGGGPIFADVPAGYWARAEIEALYHAGITRGCALSPLAYCPESAVTRAEMAVFLLRATHGPGYAPPAATGQSFADVPAGHWAAAWIEQLGREGITRGCGPGIYCPDAPVDRAQMAVFLLRAVHGAGYAPPAATGVAFHDVPPGHWAAAWIEQLAREGITLGCGGGAFCPASPVTRAQMAVFLVRAFALPVG